MYSIILLYSDSIPPGWLMIVWGILSRINGRRSQSIFPGKAVLKQPV